MINDLFPREGSSVLLKNRELIRTDTIDCMRAVSKKTQLNVDQLYATRTAAGVLSVTRNNLTNRAMDWMAFRSICNEIHRLLRVLWSGKWAIITPSALLDSLWKFVPQFRNYKQQDAQEFLYCILDRMNQELTGTVVVHARQSTTANQPTNPKLTRERAPELLLALGRRLSQEQRLVDHHRPGVWRRGGESHRVLPVWRSIHHQGGISRYDDDDDNDHNCLVLARFSSLL